MPPKTRRAAQRLAEINATYKTSIAESTKPQNDVSPSRANKKATTTSPKNMGLAPAIKLKLSTTKRPTRKARYTHKMSDDPFDPKSDLASIDLPTFLGNESAWNALTDEQKLILKKMCDQDSMWGQSEGEQPMLGLLIYDMHWRSDVRVFQEGIGDGYAKGDWIKEAEEASKNRYNGDFDRWKLNEFEQYWGQKMEEDEKAFSNRKQRLLLTDLFANGQLQVGDEWLYSRSFGRGKTMVIVEHKFRMTGMDDYGKAQFQIEALAGRASPEKRSCDEMGGQDGEFARKGTGIDTPRSSKLVKFAELDITQGSSPAITGNSLAQNLPFNSNSLHSGIKPILKKPATVMASIITDRLQDLEQQILAIDGREQKCGRTDTWKYFAIHREGQDEILLEALRDQYWDKHPIAKRKMALNGVASTKGVGDIQSTKSYKSFEETENVDESTGPFAAYFASRNLGANGTLEDKLDD